MLSQNPEDFESNSKSWVRVRVRVQVRVLRVRVRVQVRVFRLRVQVRVRVLKIRTRVRLEYIAGLEYYITEIVTFILKFGGDLSGKFWRRLGSETT